MKGASQVRFHIEIPHLTLRSRIALKSFILRLFRQEKTKLESLDYIFCSDQALLEINKHFLKHDYFTDIISFDLSNGSAVIGEIYISVDRVKENAQTLGVSFREELHRVIFHGALHLCGFSDKKKEEKWTMTKKEDQYLQLYFKK